VTREFLDHAEAKDGLFDRMMKDMQADQAGVKVAIRAERITIALRF